jgi:hypothetical protein
MKKPARGTNRKKITFCFDADLHERIRQQAAKDGTTMRAVVSACMERGLLPHSMKER